MAEGIAAAGFVLAGLPLLISGLQHYAQGVSTIKVLFRYHAESRDLARRLRSEKDLLHGTLLLLLQNCVDHNQLARMFNDPRDQCWRDSAGDINAALAKKLGDCHSTYLETIESMHRDMMKLHHRLKLGLDGRPLSDDPTHKSNPIRGALRRLGFGLGKSAYMDLVERIAKGNNTLERLTQQSKALEPVRANRSSVSRSYEVQRLAIGIYNSIKSKIANACDAEHKASLSMRPVERQHVEVGAVSKVEEDVTLRVVLHHNTVARSALLWETEIRVMQTATINNAVQQAPQPASGSQRAFLRARFRTTAVPMQSMTAQAGPSQQREPNEIQDLCARIQQPNPSREYGLCFGYLVDSQTQSTIKHGIFWPQNPLLDEPTSSQTITLGSMIASPGNGQVSRLSEADVRRLGPAIASGMLRLHDTPWLDKNWGRDDIVMYTSKGKALTSHPFVTAHFRTGNQSSVPQPSNQVTHYRGIGNETLFALGIVLIELCLRKPFDELIGPEWFAPDGSKYPGADFLAANRLFQEIYDRAGGRYGDVVRRCIRCEFDQRQTSLNDPKFRAVVYENVVAVLQEDERQFFNL